MPEKPEQYIANTADLTAVADAIRTKGGTTDTLTFPDGFVSAIGNLGSGEPVQPKDVNFIDYDGTVLHSYTVAEAAALTALPALPSHDGLTCQGWNWSLADIKALGRAVTAGAMYITDDGKTRIYIHLEEGRTSPVLGCCPNGTVTVDWGDGTTPDTLTGASTTAVQWTPTHNYAAPGDYVIKLTVSGSMGFYGSGTSNPVSKLLGYSSADDNRNKVYLNAVKKIEIGGGVTSIGVWAFSGGESLSNITIPNGVTSIGAGAFNGNLFLSSIVIPDGVTTIENKTLNGCYNLSNISIPNSVMVIRDAAFGNCRILSGINIPDSVVSIAQTAFGGCFALSNITIPNGVKAISASMLYNCYRLSSIIIPDSVTFIGDSAFCACHSLSSIAIPDSVTTIYDGAFSSCYGMKFYDFTAATAVPSLINTDAFENIANDCEIRVPIALYEELIAATNWSTYADHIVYVGTPYYLDVSINDGGTVTPTGQVFAPPGCTRTLKIVPDGTHELSDIMLDGTSVKSAATYADASSNSVSVEAVDGASYGFALNTNGYYESQNKGKSQSAAVCKIAITVLAETAMSLDIINSGESKYDYGLLGAVDQVLITTNSADFGVAWSGKGKSSTDVVNVPFTIPAGKHYIYAKFIKDGSGDDGNDSLQFKVNLPTESFWAYTIENVQSDHDIVVTFGAKGA